MEDSHVSELKARRLCSTGGCGKGIGRHGARGLCLTCYDRLRYRGEELPPLPTLAERFYSKTRVADSARPGMSTPCLEWTAYRDQGEYGHFKLAGSMPRAHRVAWELEHGKIPDGLQVLHKCDNPPCVRAEHLFLGTPADNAADRDVKGRHNPACGERNGARLHPESLARGDRSGARLHPESRARGERNGNSKLTTENVTSIFQLHAESWSQRRIAKEFGVSGAHIDRILSHRNWVHVRMPEEHAQQLAKGKAS